MTLRLIAARKTAPTDATHPASPSARPGSLDLVGRALGFGLLSGCSNLAVVLTRRAVVPTISMAALRTNRHAVWMIPASNLVLFLVAGLALATLARFRRPLAERLSWPLLTGLAVLASALDVEGLYTSAACVLALGCGLRLGPLAARLVAARGRPVARGLALLAIGFVTLTAVVATTVARSESRALAALPPPPADRPNVLLLVLDNVRAESMSLYGHTRPTTPNLERLARRGTLFREARSTSSWTLPSHASLMTGHWCNDLNFGFDRPLDASRPTLAEILARAGYVTGGFVGNTYYGNILYGLGRGFARYEDHYENLEVSPFEVVRSTALGKIVLKGLGYPIHVHEGASVRKSAAMLNGDLLAWIDGRPSGRPFFGFVNYFDAHAPFVAPKGFDTRFGTAALPDSEKSRLIKRSVTLHSKPLLPGEDPDQIRTRANEVARDSYETCLAYLDQELGRLIDALDRRGLTDNTLIVVTSDHGEHFGERGFSGHGRSLYRPELHVPLLVVWPRSYRDTHPAVVDDPVSNREFAATAADLAGLAPASPLPGPSLARFRRDAPAPDPTPVLSELDHQKHLAPMREVPASLGPVRALIARGKVYIKTGRDIEELYDLHADRREQTNLLAPPEATPSILLERNHARLLLDQVCRQHDDRAQAAAADQP